MKNQIKDLVTKLNENQIITEDLSLKVKGGNTSNNTYPPRRRY